MANLRGFKKDIDFVISEVIYDCYLSMYFHPEHRDKVMEVITDAVDTRNDLYSRANKPAEKHNKSLVKKHYKHLRTELVSKADDMFKKLSEATASK